MTCAPNKCDTAFELIRSYKNPVQKVSGKNGTMFTLAWSPMYGFVTALKKWIC